MYKVRERKLKCQEGKQQEHDRIKQRFAKDDKYRLLRPTYKTNTQEKINKYLDRYLLKTLDK